MRCRDDDLGNPPLAAWWNGRHRGLRELSGLGGANADNCRIYLVSPMIQQGLAARPEPRKTPFVTPQKPGKGCTTPGQNPADGRQKAEGRTGVSRCQGEGGAMRAASATTATASGRQSCDRSIGSIWPKHSITISPLIASRVVSSSAALSNPAQCALAFSFRRLSATCLIRARSVSSVASTSRRAEMPNSSPDQEWTCSGKTDCPFLLRYSQSATIPPRSASRSRRFQPLGSAASWWLMS